MPYEMQQVGSTNMRHRHKIAFSVDEGREFVEKLLKDSTIPPTLIDDRLNVDTKTGEPHITVRIHRTIQYDLTPQQAKDIGLLP